MILSAEQLLSDQQAITGTAVSTNVINLGTPGTPVGGAAALSQDIGKGNKIPFVIQVTEAFNNLTSLTIAIETGATTSLGTVVVSKTYALAAINSAGTQFSIDVVPNDVSEKYLGVRYTVSGSSPSAGAVTAGVTMGNQTN